MGEDYERVLEKCQKYLEKVPTIIIGSGFSVPYGLPSMWELGEELKRELAQEYSTDEEWIKFVEILDETENLELALQKASLGNELYEDIIKATWRLINKKDTEVYDCFLKSRRKTALTIIFDKLLQSHPMTVNVITTNYDRIIEYSADSSGASIDYGYKGEFFKRFTSIDQAINARVKEVKLCKVHGSLDWFKRDSDHQLIAITKSRELYEDMTPVIVTPGLQKYQVTHHEPYRSLIGAADKLINDASSYLCIGYGFNDEHIQPKLIEQIQRAGKPIVIITKRLSDMGRKILEYSKKYLVFEEVGKKTKVTLDGEEIIIDDEIWKLDKFAKMWIG